MVPDPAPGEAPRARLLRYRLTGKTKEVRVGLQGLHSSHALAWMAGYTFCRKCGAWATEVPRGLGRPCHEPTQAGLDVLSRLGKGRTPKASIKHFPRERCMCSF